MLDGCLLLDFPNKLLISFILVLGGAAIAKVRAISMLGLPVLGTAPASFRLVNDRDAAIRALQPDSVSAVQLQRDPTIAASTSYDAWRVADTRASLPICQAVCAHASHRFISSHYGAEVPDAIAKDMSQLVNLVADCALREGGVSADAQVMVRSRLLVVRCDQGPMCPRLHYDKVALRLACTYSGEGTRWLPQDAVNIGALRRLIRPTSTDTLLKRTLMQDTRLYNTAVRWPWRAERHAETGDVLLMKGSAWRRGQPRARGLDEQRAIPVLHRSPDVQPRVDKDGVVAATKSNGFRALFTVDYGGD